MFKQTIEYTDFNGEERKEDFYFHLSLPEVTRIEAKAGTTFKNHIEFLVATNRTAELLDFIEELILTSYGEKTSDGRSFRKNDEIRENFSNSQAYAELFEKLLTEEGLAQKFGEKVAEGAGDKKRNTIEPRIVQD